MADLWDGLADALVSGSVQGYVRDLTERFRRMLAECVDNPDELATYTRAVASRVAMGVWAEHEGEVTEECRRAFEEAMSAEDEAAVAALERPGTLSAEIASSGLSAYAANRVDAAARQLAEIVRRQNVALAETFAERWYEAVSEAVTRSQMGDFRSAVMEDACRALADAGIETVDYKSGRSTTVDAAVRRHVVTQQAQCRAELLDERLREWGHDLVYTSSHYGARPEHRPWQGRVFSRFGRTPGYETLAEGTGYGTVTGLCGANCRHRFHPYVPGLSQLPDATFASQEAHFGMSSDEYYAATQRQRAMERAVRMTKRRIAVGQAEGLDMAADRYLLGRQQARLAAHVKANRLTRDYSRERAYGVDEQPRALRLSVRENAAREDARRYRVDERRVASKAYASRLRGAMGPCGEVAVEDARRMLRHRAGTAMEDLYAYDLTEGRRLDSATGSRARMEARPTERMRARVEAAVAAGHEVAMMHNHPGSSMPSASDVLALRTTGAKRGVIACHDGTLYTYELVGDPAPGYTLDDESLRLAYERRRDDEHKAFEAIERMFGVRIEHLA